MGQESYVPTPQEWQALLADVAKNKADIAALQQPSTDPPVDPDPPIDPPIDPDPPIQPPTGSGNDYFDAHKDAAIFAKGYRSQAEINEDTASTLQPGETNPQITYDPTWDAARIDFAENVHSLESNYQIRSKFNRVTDGQITFVWDWAFAFEWAANHEPLELLKSFQLANTVSQPEFEMTNGRLAGRMMQPGTRRIELRHWWISHSFSPIQLGPGYMAWCDVRADYIDNSDSDLQMERSTNYQLPATTWQRWYARVDFATKTLDVWIADETRDPVHYYKSMACPRLVVDGIDPDANGLDWFWLEFHGTQPRIGPASRFGWYRNLMVFHNHMPPLERPMV